MRVLIVTQYFWPEAFRINDLALGGERDRVNVGPGICGESAEFFDPTDPGSLVEPMRRVLINRNRRDELIRMGQARVTEFSWDKTATTLLAVFEEAVGAPNQGPA